MIPLPSPEYIFTPLRWAGTFVASIFKRFTLGSGIPKETIRIVPQPNQLIWSKGKDKSGNEIAVASCKFFVTNITKGQVIITDSYLKRPKSSHAMPMLIDDYRAYSASNNPIPPGQTTELHCTYAITNSGYEENKDIDAEAVIVDQLGNKHKCKRLQIKSR